MFIKLTQLALCFIFAMCQGTNGCSNSRPDNKDTSICKHNSKVRFEKFGIDCCNEVAYSSMKNFQKNGNDIFAGLDTTVS